MPTFRWSGPGFSPLSILLAKSHIRVVHVWPVLETPVCQRARPRAHDFAGSIIFDGELQQKGRLLAGMLYWNSGGPLGQVAVEQTKHCRVQGRIDCCQARLYRASTSKAPQPPCQPIPQLKGGFAINHDVKSMSLR
jgi:hypothetical protein